MEAKITELFPSIQGEGIYVGQPQIFIRFEKCNANCDFCDTVKRGGRAYGVYDILDRVNRINETNMIDTISITGGEPLLYAGFLELLLPQLRRRNLKIYLETNGTLPMELERILNLVDIIAMDIKLPSSQKGQRSFWTKHRDFLNRAVKKDVFVKVVVTGKTTQDEIKKAVRIIGDINSDIPLVLQPVTPSNRVNKKAALDKVFKFQKLAKTVLNDIRVIPQVHKALGAR